MSYALAFDFGATSIRGILGRVVDGKFETKEVMRFKHERQDIAGRSRWDWPGIVNKVVSTIIEHQHEISSIAVNTWGVDFGLVGKDGQLIEQPISYRDPLHNLGYTYATSKLSPAEMFLATGNQVMSINSLFQLLVHDALKAQADANEGANNDADTNTNAGTDTGTDVSASGAGADTVQAQDQVQAKARARFDGCTLLMLPDLLNYLLTGEKRMEQTIASTSQLVDLRTQKLSTKLASIFNIPESLFAPGIAPTNIVGSLKNSVLPELSKLQLDVPVVACASHDTASAVLMTSAYTDQEIAFLSCGTWSLIGGLTAEPIISPEVFAQNLTNETGFNGVNLFFKNITGLYIIAKYKAQLEAKLGKTIPFAQITEYVSQCAVELTFDVDAPVFSQNEFEVQSAIDKLLGLTTPLEDFAYFKVIYLSLAHKYQQTLHAISQILGRKFKQLHMIGGGTQSEFLCQLVADTLNLPVIAGPMEATAYGNLLAQFIACGQVPSLAAGRELILKAADFKTYKPRQA